MTQVEFNLVASPSQNAIILDVLQRAGGRWVPMLVLEQASGSRRMNSRCADLRRRGHNIENKTDWINGKCRSWYRLLDGGRGEPNNNSLGNNRNPAAVSVLPSGTGVENGQPAQDPERLTSAGSSELLHEAGQYFRGCQPTEGSRDSNPWERGFDSHQLHHFPAGTPAVGLPKAEESPRLSTSDPNANGAHNRFARHGDAGALAHTDTSAFNVTAPNAADRTGHPAPIPGETVPTRPAERSAPNGGEQ